MIVVLVELEEAVLVMVDLCNMHNVISRVHNIRCIILLVIYNYYNY